MTGMEPQSPVEFPLGALIDPFPREAPYAWGIVTCSNGHNPYCEGCHEEYDQAVYRLQAQWVARELRRRAEGHTYMWRVQRHKTSKVHLLTCQHAEYWLSGNYEDSFQSPHHWGVNEFRFATQYPRDMPICGMCEYAMDR